MSRPEPDIYVGISAFYGEPKKQKKLKVKVIVASCFYYGLRTILLHLR